MIRKEIRRFLNTVFDGSAPDLVAQLAAMDALSLSDLRELEETISDRDVARNRDRSRKGEME
jgi:predicted transcriptional regulator